MSSDLKVGDLVWAKMKGFPPWPGIIVNPPKDLKKSAKKAVGNYCIYFFGTRNYGWIEEGKLKPYADFKEEFKKTTKSTAFKDALLEIEEYSEKGNKSIINDSSSEDIFNNLMESPASPSVSKTPKPRAKSVSFDNSFDKPPKSPKVASASKESSSEDTQKIKKSFKKIKKVNGKTSLDSDDKRKPQKRFSDSFSSDPKTKKRMLKFPDADTTTPTVSHRKWGLLGMLDKSDLEQPNETSLNSTPDEEKQIAPGEFTVGFIGLGMIGSAVVRNLINHGHKVIVWNRTADKCKEFTSSGVEIAVSPGELANSSDVICCCVSDSNAAKEIVFGSKGILPLMNNKSLIQMTGIDLDSTLDISEAISSNGGRYLEAPIHGRKEEADEGSLIVLTAGDRSLFEDCSSLFESFAKRAVFLGNLGNATKMYIVLQLITGITLAGLAEGMALAEKTGVSQNDLFEVLTMSMFNCPMMNDKCDAMKNCDYTAKLTLGLQHKDMRLALFLADNIEQPIPMGAASNELFKHAMRLGYGSHDAAAVFVRSKF